MIRYGMWCRACQHGKQRHPTADKLTLVDVVIGPRGSAGEVAPRVTTVVCGAPNVPEPGGKVAWAMPGARLPNPDGPEGSARVLEAREVRGVISPGMLCAEDELGLGEPHAGIIHLDADAEPGADVAALLGLPDTILELNVTPNRPDCMGHLGVAREVAALFAPDARDSRDNGASSNGQRHLRMPDAASA